MQIFTVGPLELVLSFLCLLLLLSLSPSWLLDLVPNLIVVHVLHHLILILLPLALAELLVFIPVLRLTLWAAISPPHIMLHVSDVTTHWREGL